ncbi:MAG: M14 family zinc carboxypeptidase [candidate division WOR-3 bacterium]
MKFFVVFFACLATTIGYTIPDRYHSYFEMVALLDSFASRYPNIAHQCTIGFSQTESLPILAMKISDNPGLDEDEPSILFTGVHHGCELLGCEICLYLCNHLLANYDTNALIRKIIDSTEIWVVPIVNPDGQGVVFAGLDSFWRKNTRDNNNNGVFDLDYDGVDLNRNYNFLFDSGGSGNPSSRTYRGQNPVSEAETRAMTDLAKRENFLLEICYHSDKDSAQGERVYYPWRWGNANSPDFPFIKPIAESIAKRIKNDLGNGTYTPVIGLVDGGLYRNYLYHAFGTFAYTIEVSTRYIPPEEWVDSICERNLAGAYYLLERTFGPAIAIRVFDSLSGSPLRAKIKIIGIDSTYPIMIPRFSDSIFGRFRRIVNPGNYTIEVSKAGYSTKQVKASVNDSPVELNINLTPTAWSQVQSIPKLPSNKPVGGGASLVTVNDSLIFALKGNNTRDFYCYNINNDFWAFVDSIPYGLNQKKKVKNGAALCYDQKQYLYLTKGNNTKEFWRYNLRPTANERKWVLLPDVPGEKRLKGGTGLVYVPDSFVYLLKGSGTKEFYCFHLPYGPWQQLPSPPGEKGFKRGSALALADDSLIYCLKGGSKTNEFYVYNIKDSSWRRLASLPIKGSSGRNKRVKDGGALIFTNGFGWALKGGNSSEFWQFFSPQTLSDTGYWTEKEQLPTGPSNKKVKAGGALTSASKFIYAFKGAKTNEFWVYYDWSKFSIDSYSLSQKHLRRIKNRTTINFDSYILPNTNLVIYNSLGVKVASETIKGTQMWQPFLKSLPSGVYFIKVISNDKTQHRIIKKIIIR